MRIKTLFLTLAVMLLAFMSTLSASAANYVKVSDKDGKDTYFAPTSQQVLERLMQKATIQSFLLVTP